MNRIALALCGYGLFLMLCGLTGYLSNPEKAKTALLSGGTFGLLNLALAGLALRGWRPSVPIALGMALLLGAWLFSGGATGAARDPALDTVAGRLDAHDAIDAGIDVWTRERKPHEVMHTLLDAGVPAGHVQRSSDLLADPHLQHRGFHREYEHGEMGVVPYAGHQFRISGYDNGPRGPAPLIGADSFAFLTEDLGFDAAKVAEWMADAVIY